MVTADYCQTLARYNEWMNSRLYALCSTLPEVELRADRGAFFGSIYATLNHIAYADLAFLARFTGEPKVVPELGADLFGGFAALRAERERIDQRLLALDRDAHVGVAGRETSATSARSMARPARGRAGCWWRISSTIRRTTAARSRPCSRSRGSTSAAPTCRSCRTRIERRTRPDRDPRQALPLLSGRRWNDGHEDLGFISHRARALLAAGRAGLPGRGRLARRRQARPLPRRPGHRRRFLGRHAARRLPAC